LELENCDHCADDAPKHADVIPLINRIGGQVAGIGKMVEEGRYCPDILNQVKAARSALRTLEGRILRTHLQSCVRETFRQSDPVDQDMKIEEIVKLFSKYDEADN
jgi:CsoR family transcriptional regulator, copper-sensing transcriptional repressor